QVSAVTAACLVVGREKFEAAGGFDEAAFPVAFNDVDLCLRLAGRGWRTIWTPRARLIHLESATRGSEQSHERAAAFAREAAALKARWGAVLAADPFYNPNLTLADESFGLAPESRAAAPWR
ncbi:MAG: glycosyltransferase family 2 protein, partial [Caulobacteraceae bacterium]